MSREPVQAVAASKVHAAAKDAWADLELRPTGRTGMGLFAKRPFARGEVIARVEGTSESYEYDDEPGYGGTWYAVARGEWVVPFDDSPSRFVNHSCEPSARMADVRTIVAAREIGAGEEITVDYAETEEDPSWVLMCRCGSEKCRGEIRGSLRFDA